MVFPYPDQEKTLSWYNFGVTMVWPNLMLWTKRDWRGQEHLGEPGQGMVCAANHISWFDPLILLHYANDMGRPARFLAKDSLFELPFLGTVMTGAGTIPVHRESGNAGDAVSAAVEAAKGGEMIFIYPEGTITRDPDLWPMTGKTGAARVALLADVPLVPVAHWGSQEIMGPYKVELKVIPRKTIHVVAGEPVDLDDLRGRPLTEPLLAEATTRVMDAITELEAGLRDETPPQGRWNRKAEQREPILHGVAAYEQAFEDKD